MPLYEIQATTPMKATVGAIATYPFFFSTYKATWPCKTRQPFTALDGESPKPLDQRCDVVNKKE